MPLPHQVRIQRCQIIESRQCLFPCAIGTTCSLDTAKHTRLIVVAQLAAPPDFFRAALPHFCGQQIPIFQWMPLVSKFRIPGSQISLSRNCFFSRTVGTSTAVDQRIWRNLPLVSLLTLPPAPLVSKRHDILRCEGPVSGWMPSRGYLRVSTDEVRLTGKHSLARTVGTSLPPLGTQIDIAAPLVTTLAAPPHSSVTANGDLIRAQLTVFLHVPLGDQLRPPSAAGVFS